MKRILFVLDTLGSGGAQKSLVNFLAAFSESGYDAQVDLLLFSSRGLFINQVPDSVHRLKPAKEISCMFESLNSVEYWTNLSIKGFLGKVFRLLSNPLIELCRPDLNDVQRLWMSWSYFIPNMKGSYDLAVGCLEGTCNYYVIDKVDAKRKILWFHSNYDDHGYNSTFDRRFFLAADRVATISDECLASLTDAFPDMQDKFIKLENITSASFIRRKANEFAPDVYTEGALNLLTVGRLMPVKGYDLLIDAAVILKELNYNFVWRCIGEGDLFESLSELIESRGLKKNVLLLGPRENPYPYMSACDVFVQTSRYEGKSIVVDEAKILCKPIIITNYATARDAIDSEVNGLICEMTPEGIARSIARLWLDRELRQRFVSQLSTGQSDVGSTIEEYAEAYDI